MSFAKKSVIVKTFCDKAKEDSISLKKRIGLFSMYLVAFILPIILLMIIFIYLPIWHLGKYAYNRFSLTNKTIKAREIQPSHTLSIEEKRLAQRINLPEHILLAARGLGDDLQQFEPMDATGEGKKEDWKGFSFAIYSQSANKIVRQFEKNLTPMGIQVFRSEQYFDIQGKPDRISIVKTADQFDILRMQETNGDNYEISNEKVIAKVKEWDQRFGLRIIGAGLDWLEIDFINQPKDIQEFAEEVYTFCPDVVDQGAAKVESLANEMKKTNTLYLWWD